MLALNLPVMNVKPSVNIAAVNASNHNRNIHKHVIMMASIVLIQWTIDYMNYERLYKGFEDIYIKSLFNFLITQSKLFTNVLFNSEQRTT